MGESRTVLENMEEDLRQAKETMFQSGMIPRLKHSPYRVRWLISWVVGWLGWFGLWAGWLVSGAKVGPVLVFFSGETEDAAHQRKETWSRGGGFRYAHEAPQEFWWRRHRRGRDGVTPSCYSL